MTMSSWIHHTHFEVHHLNPAWFIPVVVATSSFRWSGALRPVEISWFLQHRPGVLMIPPTVVMYRLFFHAPLALRLTPTLFILLAPPSVGFIASTATWSAGLMPSATSYHTAPAFWRCCSQATRRASFPHPVLRLGVGLFLPGLAALSIATRFAWCELGNSPSSACWAARFWCSPAASSRSRRAHRQNHCGGRSANPTE